MWFQISFIIQMWLCVTIFIECIFPKTIELNLGGEQLLRWQAKCLFGFWHVRGNIRAHHTFPQHLKNTNKQTLVDWIEFRKKFCKNTHKLLWLELVLASPKQHTVRECLHLDATLFSTEGSQLQQFESLWLQPIS